MEDDKVADVDGRMVSKDVYVDHNLVCLNSFRVVHVDDLYTGDEGRHRMSTGDWISPPRDGARKAKRLIEQIKSLKLSPQQRIRLFDYDQIILNAYIHEGSLVYSEYQSIHLRHKVRNLSAERAIEIGELNGINCDALAGLTELLELCGVELLLHVPFLKNRDKALPIRDNKYVITDSVDGASMLFVDVRDEAGAADHLSWKEWVASSTATAASNNNCTCLRVSDSPAKYKYSKKEMMRAPKSKAADDSVSVSENLYNSAQSVRRVFKGGLSHCPKCLMKVRRFEYTPPAEPLVHTKRTYGVEIEADVAIGDQIKTLEKVVSGGILNKYQPNIQRDGSLKTVNSVEYASPPMPLDEIREWVSELCNTAKPRVYKQCGLHIWVGVKDYSWADLNRLLVFCKRNESFFNSIIPSSRKLSSRYNRSGAPMKLPAYSTSKSKSAFMTELYGEGVLKAGSLEHGNLKGRRANEQGVSHFPDGNICRYHWLNVHPYFRCRAVEIRLHHGSGDPVRITKWIELWSRIIVKVKNMTNKEMMSTTVLDLMTARQVSYWKSRIKFLNDVESGLVRFTTEPIRPVLNAEHVRTVVEDAPEDVRL